MKNFILDNIYTEIKFLSNIIKGNLGNLLAIVL